MNKYQNLKLYGWTLSEMLVMMIVSGIGFLAVMDGVALLSRYTNRKSKQIIANMYLYEGYYLLRDLAVSADSVSTAEDGHIGLFIRDIPIARLFKIDSMLVCMHASRTDTLISRISDLRLVETFGRIGADTIKLTIEKTNKDPFIIAFPIITAKSTLITTNLSEREKQYAYE